MDFFISVARDTINWKLSRIKNKYGDKDQQTDKVVLMESVLKQLYCLIASSLLESSCQRLLSLLNMEFTD
jgi:hypothetical protein